MDDALYDTSLTLYAITESTPPLNALLTANQASLNTNALKLLDHLSTGRARYEDEEEHEKIGGLRDCTWTLLQHDEDSAHGLVVSLLYDKITYRFILYAASQPAKNRRGKQASPTTLPLLLIKASTSLMTRFLAFLTLHFQSPTITPLKLPPTHLPGTLSSYIASLLTAHTHIAEDYALQAFYQDTVGTIKLTVSITTPEIAKSLRTIEVDVPPETLFQLITSTTTSSTEQTPSTANTSNFLTALRTHIHQRTGLILPFDNTTTLVDDDSTAPQPLLLSRLSNNAFALSSEGRLKFSSKAVRAVDAIPGLPGGDENVVRKANLQILEGLLDVAVGLGEDGG